MRVRVWGWVGGHAPCSPLECIFDHIPLSRWWDTMRYNGIHQIQLDTQLDTYEYS